MLNLRNLRLEYPSPGGEPPVRVLDIPTWTVAAGEQVALVGASGSGKTTLLNVIAGLVTPDEGEVRLDDTDITRLDEVRRDRFRAAHIGYVFQNIHLLPAFTALENVALGMKFADNRAGATYAQALLDKVGLRERARYFPRQLSAGQQQRVGVARALANRPKLVLADEPTSALDARNRDAVLDLMQKLCAEIGAALIVVTHDEAVARRFPTVLRLSDINRAN
ncbi:MAG: ABC transporter ATP-binding protein [Chloracidobacterium sp.]|nr:ABC transporter ATP-binding protein [Chloracidobacterium sp.]MDW8218869.1 ABC transporter ATP-binding protein [Acidobacteriota bacterium]